MSTNDQFSATASGSTSGLARMFSSGKGSTVARGAIKNGQLVPASYVVSMKWGKRSEDLRMKLADGAIKEVSIEPPAILNPDRIPVTDAHRRNVLDPMTGALLRVQGNGDLMAPETCKQHAAIFDGRMRYDLTLAYKRIEQVNVPGYAGPALVCAIYFAPLAGHVPGSGRDQIPDRSARHGDLAGSDRGHAGDGPGQGRCSDAGRTRCAAGNAVERAAAARSRDHEDAIAACIIPAVIHIGCEQALDSSMRFWTRAL